MRVEIRERPETKETEIDCPEERETGSTAKSANEAHRGN